MTTLSTSRLAAALVLGLGLGGCVAYGPDYGGAYYGGGYYGGGYYGGSSVYVTPAPRYYHGWRGGYHPPRHHYRRGW
jgi:hypothetical protein